MAMGNGKRQASKETKGSNATLRKLVHVDLPPELQELYKERAKVVGKLEAIGRMVEKRGNLTDTQQAVVDELYDDLRAFDELIDAERGPEPTTASNVETGQHTTERKTRRVTPPVRPIREQSVKTASSDLILQGIADLTKVVKDISGRVGDLEKKPASRGSIPVQDSANVPTARQRSKAANERNKRRETFAGTAGVPVYDGTFEVSVSKKGHVQIAGFWHGKGVSVMSVERFAEFLRLLRSDDCEELVNVCTELGLFDDDLAERIYEL